MKTIPIARDASRRCKAFRSLRPHVVLRRPQIRPIRQGFHTSGFDRDRLAIAKPDATRFSEQALNDRLEMFVLAFAIVMLANASARGEATRVVPYV